MTHLNRLTSSTETGLCAWALKGNMVDRADVLSVIIDCSKCDSVWLHIMWPQLNASTLTPRQSKWGTTWSTNTTVSSCWPPTRCCETCMPMSYVAPCPHRTITNPSKSSVYARTHALAHAVKMVDDSEYKHHHELLPAPNKALPDSHAHVVHHPVPTLHQH